MLQAVRGRASWYVFPAPHLTLRRNQPLATSTAGRAAVGFMDGVTRMMEDLQDTALACITHED